MRLKDTPRRRSPEERFWLQVYRNGPTPKHCPELGPCWLWTGLRMANHGGKQYGRFGVAKFRPNRGAHQVAWRMATSLPVDRNHPVCHACDNPLCVRNDTIGFYEVNGILLPRRGHLFQATPRINTADMMAKGRYQCNIASVKQRPRGEENGHARLTEDQVLEIRARYKPGLVRQADLAAEYGVCCTVISCVVGRRSWKHI